ncbi:hypothetical protein BDZ31_002974 [Conexibacter arvalis]|uniref:CHRD domain-containing protein n=2 Tax=Conexibacter arvalis TaxID=912552 RepID=A0A840IEX5_9ACTN|nr:hypothetical protein [Conexibacter arvalis]
MAATAILAAGGAAIATGQDDGRRGQGGPGATTFRASLTGYEEVPAVSTEASGRFRATLDARAGRLAWRLSYRELEGAVQQAHIHFGQVAVNGGVSVFLCTNLPGAPAGVQRCPPPPATISGVATAASVVGPARQGIGPGDLGELVAAMRAGVTYANVHSDTFPDGEARGQIAAIGRRAHARR